MQQARGVTSHPPNFTQTDTCCYPNNDIKNINASVQACCAACQSLSSCKGWTHNSAAPANQCFLKVKLQTANGCNTTCVSGTANGGTFPPSSTPLLFNVQSDPEERNDLASQNPSIVQRLQARLTELHETAINPPGGGGIPDPSCPAYDQSKFVDPVHGPYWSPFC